MDFVIDNNTVLASYLYMKQNGSDVNNMTLNDPEFKYFKIKRTDCTIIDMRISNKYDSKQCERKSFVVEHINMLREISKYDSFLKLNLIVHQNNLKNEYDYSYSNGIWMKENFQKVYAVYQNERVLKNYLEWFGIQDGYRKYWNFIRQFIEKNSIYDHGLEDKNIENIRKYNSNFDYKKTTLLSIINSENCLIKK